jgi:sec-independent protein translocase protein TatC
VTGLLFWIGIAFEFPLVIYVLTAMGLIKPQFLSKQWRYAIVILAILAAAITPTVDPGSMMIVMAPMALLYFVSIGLSYMAQATRRKVEKNNPEQAGQVFPDR